MISFLAFRIRYLLAVVLIHLCLFSHPAIAKPLKDCLPLTNSLTLLDSAPDGSSSKFVVTPEHYSQLGKFPDTPAEFEKYFSVAQKKYLKKVIGPVNKEFKHGENLSELQKIIKKVAEKGKTSVEKLDRLKKDRIFAQRVRGSYRIFSLEHLPPRDFHRFVRDFGYLNDALIEGKPKKAMKMAKKVLKHIKENNHRPDRFGFKPAIPGSIVDYSMVTFNKISADLSKPIDIHRYHDIKKEIRDFKFTYSLLNKHYPSVEYQRLGKKAATITDEMGATKDFLFTDKSIDKHALVVIDKKIQKDIVDFIEEFKKINNVK